MAFEDLPQSDTTAEFHIQTLRALTQRAGRLKAEHEELRRRREQLVVATLENGLLDPPWVAAVSGLTLERVNILAQQTRRTGSLLKQTQTPDTQT